MNLNGKIQKIIQTDPINSELHFAPDTILLNIYIYAYEINLFNWDVATLLRILKNKYPLIKLDILKIISTHVKNQSTFKDCIQDLINMFPNIHLLNEEYKKLQIKIEKESKYKLNQEEMSILT